MLASGRCLSAASNCEQAWCRRRRQASSSQQRKYTLGIFALAERHLPKPYKVSQRILRVNQLLKQEVSQSLSREIDFDGVLVTITKVDASDDLKQAKVKISVMPTEKSEQVLRILEKNIYHLQQILNKKLTMKTVPKIRFVIDQTEVKAQRIEEILEKMKKG